MGIYKSSEGKRKIMDFYNEAMKSWPVSYEEFIIETSYGKIYAVSSGKKDAPMLFLIHGSASNSASWIGEAEKLSENFRIIAVDVPGEPGKSTEKRLNMNSDESGLWFREVVNYFNAEKFFLLGYSQGGWYALKYSVLFPQSLNGLILMAPGGVSPAPFSFIFKAVIYSFLGEKGTEKINKMVYGKKDPGEEVKKYTEIIMNNFSPRRDKVYIFSDYELGKLSMPVLTITGENDLLCDTKKTVKRLRKNLRFYENCLLKNTGHLITGISETVSDFLLKKSSGCGNSQMTV
ncbi:MAG TPA: alpha/beta hydrolase [Tepiditoga sp.]|nr:alpha/beta hydrolase [Tepiditoga sp.]